MTSINFFKENVSFRLSNPELLKKWISLIIKNKKHNLVNLNFIFCNDNYLRKINKDYLQHDYFTDIVTFDNSSSKKEIEGDIFISIDRVKKNAGSFSNTFSGELNRVMIHGVLHLLGYDDIDEKKKAKMRIQEDEALESLLKLSGKKIKKQ